MAINIGLNLYRNPLIYKLQSGYDPNNSGYEHGDIFTFINPNFGISSPTKQMFTGGYGGIIESLNAGDTLPNNSDWNFTLASHSPIIYEDAIRGKVIKNDYLNQSDLNACHTAIFGSGIGHDTCIYISRWINPIIKTTGDINYPIETQNLQLKLLRLNVANDIQDTINNTGTEVAIFREWNGGGSLLRCETGDGEISGIVTTGSSSAIIDSTKNFSTNTLKGRGVELTSGAGSGQFSLAVGNTSTTVTPQYSWSPATGIGTAYKIGSASHYLNAGEVDVNLGWQREETIIKTNSPNTANGTIVRRVWKSDGVHETINNSGMTFYLGGGVWNYLHFQNYFGTESIAPILYREIRSDDLTVIIGSQNNRRLILSNTQDLADNSQHLNDLMPISWTSGGNISLSVNTGGLQSGGDMYVLCVEGSNTVVGVQPIKVRV